MPKRGKVKRLREIFKICKNLLCKNQNKKDLLIKKILTMSTFFELVNLAKGAIFS